MKLFLFLSLIFVSAVGFCQNAGTLVYGYEETDSLDITYPVVKASVVRSGNTGLLKDVYLQYQTNKPNDKGSSVKESRLFVPQQDLDNALAIICKKYGFMASTGAEAPHIQVTTPGFVYLVVELATGKVTPQGSDKGIITISSVSCVK